MIQDTDLYGMMKIRSVKISVNIVVKMLFEIDVDGTKIPVSCHGNQCGSCLNNTNTCEKDAENNNAGVLYN